MAPTSLVFGADGNLTLDAGCNQGGGPYSVQDGVLSMRPLRLTRRACQGPEASVEVAILGVLEPGDVSFALTARPSSWSVATVG